MLRYLLDEQISPVVAEQVQQKDSRIWIASVQRWRDGEFRGRRDADLLAAAAAEQLTVVTYDLRTIPGLLREWAELQTSHSGVIFVRRKAIRENDFGRLVSALVQLWQVAKNVDWRNRVAFLPPD
ncbi:MAG TPA: DUF5615 family PIN-like protein [Bryobacteraceae bacterium]|nr:DUF5615 family PIN-like protein [Bryobacteraceae bacterium]